MFSPTLLSLFYYFYIIIIIVFIAFRYIEVDFTFGLPEDVRYIKEFVISRFVILRFYSIHFTVTLAGT